MIQHAEDDEEEDGGEAEFFFDCSPLGSPIKRQKMQTSWFGISKKKKKEGEKEEKKKKRNRRKRRVKARKTRQGKSVKEELAF